MKARSGSRRLNSFAALTIDNLAEALARNLPSAWSTASSRSRAINSSSLDSVLSRGTAAEFRRVKAADRSLQPALNFCAMRGAIAAHKKSAAPASRLGGSLIGSRFSIEHGIVKTVARDDLKQPGS